MEGAMTLVVWVAHAWDVERLSVVGERMQALRHQEELRLGIHAPPDEPGAGHPVYTDLFPGDPSHGAALLCAAPSPCGAPAAALWARAVSKAARTCSPSAE